MNTKITLIPLFIASITVHAQTDNDLYATNGIFRFVEALPLPDSADIQPGQLSKDGKNYYLGLSQEVDAEMVTPDGSEKINYVTDLYHYNLKTKTLTPLHMTGMQDTMEFFQCSMTADEKTIVFALNPYGGWTYNDLGIADKNADGTWKPYRILKETNKDSVSDAYPWLSPDGLHLYFIQDNKIYFTERKSRKDAFNAPKTISFNGDVRLEVISCWLSDDEKTIFILSNNKIYKAIRKKITDPFLLPSLYTDEFSKLEFISGLSFTPDMKDLYVYATGDEVNILHYTLK